MAISTHVGEVHDTPERRTCDHHRLLAQRSVGPSCMSGCFASKASQRRAHTERREMFARKRAMRTMVVRHLGTTVSESVVNIKASRSPCQEESFGASCRNSRRFLQSCDGVAQSHGGTHTTRLKLAILQRPVRTGADSPVSSSARYSTESSGRTQQGM